MKELDPILKVLTARTGITAKAARLDPRHPVVAKLLARARAGGIDQVLREIDSESALFGELMDELTVRETYFFRNAAQFEVIRTQILPEITSRRGDEHAIRCWSAGCASGEEAYSIAILLSEAGLGNRACVTGTDISLAALSQARAGKYRAWSLRGEGAESVRPYLLDEGECKVIRDSIRRRVTFLPFNLAGKSRPWSSAGIGEMDLVLCRNVLIYFDGATIAEVARRLFDSLAPGGWLLTAPADPLLTEYAPFDVILTKAGLAYRRPSYPLFAPALPRVEGPPHEAEIRIPALDAHIDNPLPAQRLAAARDALRIGDYVSAAALTRDCKDLAEACVLHLRALANLGDPQAATFGEQAIQRYPLCAELYYLQANLRFIQGDHAQALAMLRKAIYLAPSLIIAHFMLGSLLQRFGNLDGARRSLRNATALAEARPPDEIVPMSDGEPAAMLAAAARSSLHALSNAEV